MIAPTKFGNISINEKAKIVVHNKQRSALVRCNHWNY